MQAYNHDQASGSSAWVVSHNLNTDAVAVDVFIDFGGNLEKILPLSVDVTDNNTLTINFSSAQTGEARVIGNPDA